MLKRFIKIYLLVYTISFVDFILVFANDEGTSFIRIDFINEILLWLFYLVKFPLFYLFNITGFTNWILAFGINSALWAVLFSYLLTRREKMNAE